MRQSSDFSWYIFQSQNDLVYQSLSLGSDGRPKVDVNAGRREKRLREVYRGTAGRASAHAKLRKVDSEAVTMVLTCDCPLKFGRRIIPEHLPMRGGDLQPALAAPVKSGSVRRRAVYRDYGSDLDFLL